jgi:hypothetical protein
MPFVKFEPLEDITTYELAYCVARFITAAGLAPRHGIFMTVEQWDEIPPSVQRHFWKDPER